MPNLGIGLWYDTEAGEALDLYLSLLPGRKLSETPLPDTPGGDAMLYEAELGGLYVQLLSAGPHFKLNPAISFKVFCDTTEEVRRLWDGLSRDGQVLMPLDAYDFSPLFGWCADRYGLNWQIVLTGQPIAHKLVPSLLFTGKSHGRAEEALNRYAGLLPGGKVDFVQPYGQDTEYDKAHHVLQGGCTVGGLPLHVQDSGLPHEFFFNEAFSFLVLCDTQAEIDAAWAYLSRDPDSEACGWCKDEFGVSWQVTPRMAVFQSDDPAAARRVMQAMYPMKKIDLQQLETARDAK